MSRPSAWRLLPGGRHAPRRVAGVRVVVASPDDPPFPVAARVCEEDTFQVLAAPVEVAAAPPEHPLRLLTALWEARPLPLGAVRVKGGSPCRVRVVVYDLEADPICRPEWVDEALAGVLEEAGRRGWEALALPLLGGRGRLAPAVSTACLVAALQSAPSCLRRLWLEAEGSEGEVARRGL